MQVVTDLAQLVATTPTTSARTAARRMLDGRLALHDVLLAHGPVFPARVGMHDGRGELVADVRVHDASEAYMALAKLLTVAAAGPDDLRVCFDPRVRAGVGRRRRVVASDPVQLAA